VRRHVIVLWEELEYTSSRSWWMMWPTNDRVIPII